jgi:peptidoglycan hydrolase-like protein with peptidoglycan-binding domain
VPLLSLCLCLWFLAWASETATSGEARLFSAARRTAEKPHRAASSEFIKGGQRELKRSGYDPGPVDGKIGPSTRSALQRFQEAHGLPITREFDIPTLTKLVDRSLQP